MKKAFIFFFVSMISISVFAEKITFRTGDAVAISFTDYFFPMDVNVTGYRCTVTSIKNVEKDLWCISIAACKSNTASNPVIYDYYVKKADIIKLRRINDPIKECSLRVESITWNEAVLEIL